MSQSLSPESNGRSLDPRRARSLPAWLMSLVVHLLALVALALLVRGVEKSLTDEPDRPVSVVLAHRGENDNVEYFDEDDQSTAASAQQDSSTEEPLLPVADTDKSLLLPDIPLPGKPDNSIGASLSEQLINVPSMRTSKRRPIFPGEGDEAILAEEAALRRKRAGPSGAGAAVGIFGSGSAVGHRFVFVIDRSKSMGGDGLGALDAAAKELRAALSRLKPNHQFQVIAYHHSTRFVTDKRKMLPVTPENLAAVPGYFASMAAFGGTGHEMALLSALRLKPDVLFFLTDGGDPYLSDSQLDRITSRAGGRTSIHCVQFGFGPLREDHNFMMQLAGLNRGSYSYVDMSKRSTRP